jgi:hypothetical protein
MSTKEKELSKEEADQLQNVIDLYTAFDKLIKGIKLYQGKGSLVERLLKEAEKRMNLALEAGEVTSKITPVGPVFLGKPVFDDSRQAKYLFQLYCDGVRELSFQQGITVEEITSLANVFNADLGTIEDDLVTLLWKQDFQYIRYYAVDALGAQMSETEDLDLLKSKKSKIDIAQGGEEMKMSSSDMRLLKSRDNLNWVRICTAPAKAPKSMSNVLDYIQTQLGNDQEYSRFVAIALKVATGDDDFPMVRQLFSSLASSENVDGVTEIMECLLSLTEQGHDKSVSLLKIISSEEQFLTLLPIFKKHSQRLTPLIRRLITVSEIDPEGCVSLLSALDPSPARRALQEVLSASTIDMTAFYLDGLKDENDEIVREAIAALGSIGTDRAIGALYKSLGNPLTAIRTSALKAINGKYVASERKSLVKILKDPDRANRILALNIFSTVEERSVGSVILGVMQEGAFSKRDDEEQAMYFAILEKYPGPSVFAFLNEVLLDKNITRNKAVVKRQLIVVQTYKNMDSPDVKTMLEKAMKNWFLSGEVKNAIKAAL